MSQTGTVLKNYLLVYVVVFSETLKISRMFVQCEMLIYVKRLCCDVKHPERLRKVTTSSEKMGGGMQRCNLKTL